MSGFQQKEGSGALFVNQNKELDTHPDYQGKILIDGQEYWLSGWRKESQNGLKYLSLQANPKQRKGSKPPPKKEEEAPWDDEIPF